MIENHVPDLKYCKKLKELGYFNKNIFCYYKIKNKEDKIYAPIASELIEWLPGTIEDYNLNICKYKAFISFKNDEYMISYEHHITWNVMNFRNKRAIFLNKKLCNALAKMAIYLLENKLMEVKNEEKKEKNI